MSRQGKAVKKAINLPIKGFIDVSFVDWDSKLTSVIFLPNCNFRCPFCHNVNLVLHPEKLETIPFEYVEDQLEKRRKVASTYNNRLAGHPQVRIPRTTPESQHSYSLFVY